MRFRNGGMVESDLFVFVPVRRESQWGRPRVGRCIEQNARCARSRYAAAVVRTETAPQLVGKARHCE